MCIRDSNQADKPNAGEGVYTSVSDPVRKDSEASTSPKDWTIHRPVTEKVKDPPPEPMSKILMDHIKSLWLASASAVQVQQQVKNQLDPSQSVSYTHLTKAEPILLSHCGFRKLRSSGAGTRAKMSRLSSSAQTA